MQRISKTIINIKSKISKLLNTLGYTEIIDRDLLKADYQSGILKKDGEALYFENSNTDGDNEYKLPKNFGKSGDKVIIGTAFTDMSSDDLICKYGLNTKYLKQIVPFKEFNPINDYIFTIIKNYPIFISAMTIGQLIIYFAFPTVPTDVLGIADLIIVSLSIGFGAYKTRKYSKTLDLIYKRWFNNTASTTLLMFTSLFCTRQFFPYNIFIIWNVLFATCIVGYHVVFHRKVVNRDIEFIKNFKDCFLAELKIKATEYKSKEKASTDDKISELEKRAEDIEGNISAQKKKISDLEERTTDISKDLSDYKSKTSNAEQDIESTKEDLNAFNNEINQNLSKVTDEQSKLAETQDQLSSSNDELSKRTEAIEAQHTETIKNLAIIEGKHEQLSGSHDNLSQKTGALEEQISNTSDNVLKITDEQNNLSESHEEILMKNTELSKQIDSLNQNISNFEKEPGITKFDIADILVDSEYERFGEEYEKIAETIRGILNSPKLDYIGEVKSPKPPGYQSTGVYPAERAAKIISKAYKRIRRNNPVVKDITEEKITSDLLDIKATRNYDELKPSKKK